MKLESLKLEKFKDNTLKREQMFNLNGGTTTTAGGAGCGANTCYPYQTVSFNFGWDSIRDGVKYYHNLSNVKEMSSTDCANAQASYKG